MITADTVVTMLIFLTTIAGVIFSIELGFRLGRRAKKRSAEEEKDSSVSAIAAAILGLVAFILAFTFSIVTDRYEMRKALVRDEANTIGTAYLRTDFLPENERLVAKKLFREYLDVRLAATKTHNLENIHAALIESKGIQRQLWKMGAMNAGRDMNSNVASMYLDSLNKMIEINRLRVDIGLGSQIPVGIWIVLGLLVVLGMFGVGYQTAIAGSKRPKVTLILAVSFSLVIVLIAALDRPTSAFVKVSQQPLINLQDSMAADLK